MADEQKIEVDLPAPEPKPEPKKRKAWSKDFDPKKPPASGYEIKVPDDEWALIHGEEPLSVLKKRGYFIPEPFENETNPLGTVGKTFSVEKGCPRCTARVYLIHHHAAVCLGCGAELK